MPIPFYRPAPAPEGLFGDKIMPRAGASPISAFLFQWVTPLLKAGYSRPLNENDLWQLSDEFKCREITDKLQKNYLARFPPSRRDGPFPAPSTASLDQCAAGSKDTELRSKDLQPDPEDVKSHGKRKALRIAKGSIAYEDGKSYDMSLTRAIFQTAGKRFLMSCILSAIAQGMRVVAPLLTKRLIDDMFRAYTYHQAVISDTSTLDLARGRPIGYGIGLAIGIFALMTASNMINAKSMYAASTVGCSMRAATVDIVSRKSMRMSGKARHTMTDGKINTIIAWDAAFIEWLFPSINDLPASPFIIVVGIALLVHLLGRSALVGIGILIGIAPVQTFLFKSLYKYRRKQISQVDERVRVLSEIVSSIRSVKLFAWETHFANVVTKLRRAEHGSLRIRAFLNSTVRSIFMFMPVVAITLTFITYGLTGHDLEPGTIFAAFQLFNVIRGPIQEIGMQIIAIIDSRAAIGRVAEILLSDELLQRPLIAGTEYSIEITGDFQYDHAPDKTPEDAGGGKATVDMMPAHPAHSQAQEPFALRDIALSVPHGSLVCVVGRVGTGKSSLLLGLLNEVRQTKGHVRVGGTVSYVPQQAWVQSGTVRENILFGCDLANQDLSKVNEVIEACGLAPDVAQWQDGDLDIVLLDDPLSAVDAHVGHHLLENCILTGPFATRTRILITHSLDVLPNADLIVVIDRDDRSEGRIVQQGTYDELLSGPGTFQTLIEEFGSANPSRDESAHITKEESAHPTKDQSPQDETDPVPDPADMSSLANASKPEPAKGGTLILEEERVTGSVTWETYRYYFSAIRSPIMIVGFVAFQTLEQVSLVGNSLFLGFWSGNTLDLSTGRYMAIYAGFGAAQAIFSWAGPYTMRLAGLRASFYLFDGAWSRVMRSPTVWHDRTPTGRIISRLSKDVAILDDRLMPVANMFLVKVLDLFGTFGLITYTFPWLAFMFIPVLIYFVLSATFYRCTSREVKRIDSLLRSHVYTSLAEQLAGLAVVRAFNQQTVFERRLQVAIDNHNRAALINIALVRWLMLRLGLLMQVLILEIITVFGVAFRETVNPAKFGVVLTFALATMYSIQQLVQDFAQLEQDMRVQHYNELTVEAAPLLPTDPPETQWPVHGLVEFDSVELQYRPDLPLVLKGITFSVKPGEKVGIIGRTGAGKSSIAQALFRSVEVCRGTVLVDGIDLKTLGLETIRSRMSIIPQDAFLFTGSVRDNIDPMGIRTDAQLNDALNLVHCNASASHSLREKFRLDAAVSADGANFSAGEKQLLGLMRALVRGCKVLLLDEATSSVDPETDALIQRIIQTEFADVTLISIAHRLQTVAYYDRILVIDAGEVAEYDSPLSLFDTPGSIFRSLCDKKDLQRGDLLRIQVDAAVSRPKLD